MESRIGSHVLGIVGARRGKPAAHPERMTRFDRTWEPLLVVVAAIIVWIGTLLY